MRPEKLQKLRSVATAAAVLAVCTCSSVGAQPNWSPYTPAVARWGQASALLSDPPTLLVVGGKTEVGFAYTSAPNTPDLLSLDLSSSFDLSNPPWQSYGGVASGPSSSFHTLTTVDGSGTELVLFGGDDTTVPLPTGNDSVSELALTAPFSSTSVPTWSQGSQLGSPSVGQPMRRIRHASVAVSDGSQTRIWFFGGLKDDGSGIALDELWLLTLANDSTSTWTLVSTGLGGPPATYDHSLTAVITGSTVQLYIIGGVTPTSSPTSLASLSNVWVFTPDSASGGSWQQVQVSGTAPIGRRGHVAVEMGGGTIIIHGGASGDATQVYSDMYQLDLSTPATPTWGAISASGQAPDARWGHFAVPAAGGQAILMGFGYGSSAPVAPTLACYNAAASSWASTYTAAVNPIATTPSQTTPVATFASPTAGRPTPMVPGLPTHKSRISSDGSDPIPTSSTTMLPDSERSNTGIILGGSIAAIVVVIIVAMAAWMLARRSRRKRPFSTAGTARLISSGSISESHGGDGTVSEKTGLRKSVGVLSGLWGQADQRRRRPDMLDDEESIWGTSNHRRSWTGFAGDEEADADEEMVQLQPETARPVWSPLSGAYRNSVGSDVNEDSGSRSSNLYDPPSGSSETHGESSQTELSGEDSSGEGRERLTLPPPGPPSPLYGSSFDPSQPTIFQQLKRSSSWWARFSIVGRQDARPGAFRAIRDPTPAPDPFADPIDTADTHQWSARVPPAALEGIEEDDRTNSSPPSSRASSLLELELRSMQVAQRLRDGSGSTEVQSLLSSTPTTESDRFSPRVESGFTPGSVVWDGSKLGGVLDRSVTASPDRGLQASASAPERPLVRKPTLSSSGVRQMVAQYEKGVLPSEPQKVRKGIQSVEHGLVRKPQLFVANPDA